MSALKPADLGALLDTQPMTATKAGSELGQLLFPSQDNSAYATEFARGAAGQNAMQEARLNRAKAIIAEGRVGARQQLPAALTGVFKDPAEAALAAATLGSNDNVDIRDLGDLQHPGAAGAFNAASDAMNAGDFPAYNQQMSLAKGSQYQPVLVKDGNLMADGVGLGDAAFKVQALPQTAAEVTARLAQANASNAQAARAHAGITADKAGNYETIDTGSGLIRHNKLTNATTPIMGPDGKPVTKVHPGALPSVTEIGAILGKVRDGDTGQAVVDPQDVQQVYGYFADHPGANIANYVTHAGVGLPGALPPAGSMNLGTLTAPPPDMQAPALAVPAAQANLKQPAAKPATPADPVRPASKAEFDALPSGTPFINPADGRLLRKK